MNANSETASPAIDAASDDALAPPASTAMRTGRTPWLIAAAMAVLLPLTLWQAAHWAEKAALQAVRDEGIKNLILYISNLESELEKYEYLPLILAEEKDIIQLLQHPRDDAHRAIANSALEKINAFAEASATYVMASDGTTLASSNWNTDKSFVGKNFKFRPYFQTAMRGKAGHYFALGTTSNKPGYYLSHPIHLEEGIFGVIVVKVSMERLERTWAQGPTQVIVTDANDVVFISSQEDWRFRTLRPLPPDEAEKIKATRQYHDAPLLPLPIRVKEELGGGDRVVTIAGIGEGPGRQPRSTDYLMQTTNVANITWNFHALSRVSEVAAAVYSAMAAAGLVFLIAFLGVLYLIQRRLRFRDRLAYQQQVADTLKTARDELEVRVSDRTADLHASNVHLRREIGERERTEKTLRQTQDELVQAGKLAVLGEITTGINHELNQPLGAIRSYADNARTYLDRDRAGEARENLVTISELTERMGATIARLKGFARKGTGDAEPVIIVRAVTNALDLLAARFRNDGIEVAADLPGDPLMVMGGSVRLEQVFVNLLSNAVDAMKDSARRVLSVRLEEALETLTVFVEDTGTGIAEDDAGRIFDPFFTTKDVGKGLGLGLSITYGIVKDFGGDITAANRPGGGAVFAVTLRRAEAAAEDRP